MQADWHLKATSNVNRGKRSSNTNETGCSSYDVNFTVAVLFVEFQNEVLDTCTYMKDRQRNPVGGRDKNPLGCCYIPLPQRKC
jgi:hypothetical protein